jgi:FtsH-binding integral membrane protein
MSQFENARTWDLDYANDARTVSRFFNTVYAWMAVGLAWTAVVAWFVAHTPSLLQLVYGNGPGVMLVFALGLFAIAWITQSAALKLGAGVGTLLFMTYATLMGVMISGIFIMYELDTIGAAFFVTGGVFAVMSIYGFVTKRDLSTIGSIAVMGLFGLFAASLVNLFVASDALSWFITYGVVLVTVAIIAYQTQNLRAIATELHGNEAMLPRYAIIGSLILYIAFINLFLSILRIMGDRR